MNSLELVDRLCEICEMQAAIIREQATFIDEQLAVDEAVKKAYAAKRAVVDEKLKLLNMSK